MGKTRKSPVIPTKNFPQPREKISKGFQQGIFERKRKKLFPGKFSTFHSPWGENKAEGNQRQELMLAVMSRRLFCRAVSPFFRLSSILVMEARTVV